MVYWFDHVQNAMMMFMWATTLILFPLGMDTVNHFDYPECTVYSFDGGDENKNNVRAKTDMALTYFIIGVFLTGAYMWLAHVEASGMPLEKFLVVAAIGVAGTVFVAMAIFVLLVAILTSQCTVVIGQDADPKNGQNHSLPMFAGFYIAMMLCASIRKCGKLYMDKGNLQTVSEKHQMFDVCGGWFHIFWRMIYAWYAFYMLRQSDSSFSDKYVIPTTTVCADAMTASSLDADQQRLFENFEVGEFKNGAWVVNHHYYRMAIAAGSLTIIHACIQFYWTFVYGQEAMTRMVRSKTYYQKLSIVLGRVLGLATDVLLIIMTYVLIMHHELASCPVLDPHHKDVRDFYYIAGLYTVQVYVAFVVMKEYARSTSAPLYENYPFKLVSRTEKRSNIYADE